MTSTDLPTLEEALNSLTGWEEQAIKQKFHADFMDLKNTATVRALVFVQFKREGHDDNTAWKLAQDLTVGQCDARFDTSEEEDETDENDQPVTPAGKDGGPLTFTQ